MEFHEKLQQLRKQKGLTQEELAQALYVSRTAISKWESGRGYPGIDSLKAIAGFFSVTIDDLLSGEALLTIAEAEQTQKATQTRDLVFGLLDLSVMLFFWIPFFGQHTGGHVAAVSLPALVGIAPYLNATYWIVTISMILSGICLLALQNWQAAFWVRNKHILSLLCNTAAMLLFVVSLQPYAAVFVILFLAIKVILLLKKP